MGMYKGVEYQWTGRNGVVYLNGDMYPIPTLQKGMDRDLQSRRFIDRLLADKTHSIRPTARGKQHTDVADEIMNNLRVRKGVLDSVEADILDEIHEEIRSILAKCYGQRL